ncbi:CLUMA_CG010097, isoform A [Clunio marinus]|uniref:CLUMA_CG010097, isoform A n=1 Tax=Clunio marinus TaxID=568069 RepID=A0A1J1I9A4_9DIPT|nr:CLUMA_CG010097, isoform A [Clunio marinus]
MMQCGVSEKNVQAIAETVKDVQPDFTTTATEIISLILMRSYNHNDYHLLKRTFVDLRCCYEANQDSFFFRFIAGTSCGVALCNSVEKVCLCKKEKMCQYKGRPSVDKLNVT